MALLPLEGPDRFSPSNWESFEFRVNAGDEPRGGFRPQNLPTVGVALVGSEITYPLAAWQREEIRVAQLARRRRSRRRQAPTAPTPEETSSRFSS